jgi:hypothetical protein
MRQPSKVVNRFYEVRTPGSDTRVGADRCQLPEQGGGEAVAHAGTYDRRPRPLLTYASSTDKVRVGVTRGDRSKCRHSLLGQETG